VSKTPAPYTPAVRAGPWLVCSGQLGRVGDQLLEGFEAQLRQCLANLTEVLGTEGASLDDVVKTTVFLADIANYSELNRIYLEVFSEHRPARSAFAVAALPLGALVEIEAWAYLQS